MLAHFPEQRLIIEPSQMCIYIGNSCFAEAYKLNTDLRSNAGCVSNTQSNNYTKLILNSSCRELSNDSKQAVDRMLLSTKFVA